MLGRAGGAAVAIAGDGSRTLLRGLASAAAAAQGGGGQHTAADDGPGAALDSSIVAGGSNTTSGTYRPAVTGSVLKRHGRDLTQEAADGRLDPLIGRHDVLERTLQVLLRRTKNNPVLIGDPGVGKTAVAEGLAQLIAGPAAPPGLAGRSLISLDVGSLVAGTQYRGAFEERLTSLLNEVRMAAGRVLLFIDELHILMDAGRVEGGMNAANLLKPALARGELHCVGATTVEEYRRHIEQDGAFARRFQPVMVEEPSREEAVAWLQGLAGRYERYHGVRFTHSALEAAVQAAQRYIPDRRLPDSAIDVMDEAAARARLHAAAAAAMAASAAAQAAAVGAAAEVAQQRSGVQPGSVLAAAQAAAEAAGATASPQPVGGSGLSAAAVHALSCPHCGTPAEPPEGSDTITCSKCSFTFLSIPQEKLLLGASLFAKQLQQRQQGPRQAAASPGHAPSEAVQQETAAEAAAAATVATDAADVQQAAAAAASAAQSGPPVVDAAQVLAVVAEASGIPAEHLSQSDWQPLAELESRLRRQVAGQDGAVAAAAAAVRLGRLGLQRGSRPLAALLLAGPAGVGKSTLCRGLAEALFGSDRHLLRFNLAEFSDRASVSRLVGAPPGYVGYGDGGLLTEAVRRRPHSVVLLERVDRAHPEVLSLVLQVLESGQLQDSMGKRCDFRNALLILTTSPTSLPLPAGTAGAAAGITTSTPTASSHSSEAGAPPNTKESTTVLVADGHVHPEAFAGDAHSAGSAHGAHSAAAQCLQEDERGAGLPPQRQQPVHPLQYLPGELLSRLDSVVALQPLGETAMEQVVDLQVEEVQRTLRQQGVELSVDSSARRWLAQHSVSRSGGAQRLQSLLREHVLLPAAGALLQGRQAAGEQHAAVTALHSEGSSAAITVAVAADGARLTVNAV